MVRINKPVTFNDFLKEVVPNNPLKEEHPSAKLIYRKKHIECDMTGKKSTHLKLEKLLLELDGQLDSYHLENIDLNEITQLETLAGIISDQTKAYKKKHWKITLIFRGLFNGGHINSISQHLLNKIETIKMLPLPSTDEELKEEMLRKIPMLHQEFKATENHFWKSMSAAVANLDVLIELESNLEVNSSHPLFRAEGEHTLVACREVFKDLCNKSHIICTLMDATGEGIQGSQEMAHIYTTVEFQEYANASVEAASYYKELSALCDSLGKENVFDGELDKLDLPPEEPGFETDSKGKLSLIVRNSFAPAMQRLMRHGTLMNDLWQNTPKDSEEYSNITQGFTAAQTASYVMNLKIHKKLNI